MEGQTCQNCESPLHGPFCAQCGQRHQPGYPRMRDIWADLWEDLFKLDSKLISTLRLAVLEPGRLSLEYFAGRRARYLSPFKFYLFSSFLFFLIAQLSPYNEAWKQLAQAPGDNTPEARIVMMLLNDTFRVYTSSLEWIYILSVPFTALSLALLFRRKNMPLAAHLVVSLHIYAFLFFLTVPLIFNMTSIWANLVSQLGSLVYVALVFRKAYSHKIGWAIFKAIGFLAMTSVLTYMVFGGIAIYFGITKQQVYLKQAQEGPKAP